MGSRCVAPRPSGYLDTAIERTPRLRRVTWVSADGTVLADREARKPNPEGEWREAPARVELPDGGHLDCVFAIEAQYFADLAEARDLAETVQGLDALRSEIRRSYVRAFGALLVVWAAAAAVLGIWLARRTTRRVSRLVAAVQRLAGGDLQVQVDPGGFADEVAGLTRAFNQMVREVREGRDRIVYLEKISGWQEVARRLAHEIKNPLTPMKLAFQQLQARWAQLGDAATRLRQAAGRGGRRSCATRSGRCSGWWRSSPASPSSPRSGPRRPTWASSWTSSSARTRSSPPTPRWRWFARPARRRWRWTGR